MKTVIITGGTKGIGADIARRFLETGYHVLIGARHRSGLAEEKQKQAFEELDAALDLAEDSEQERLKAEAHWQKEMEALQQLQEDYINALVEETKMTKEDIKKMLERKVNVYLSAEEAVKLGIADIII